MDFTVPAETVEFVERVQRFIDDYVVSAEQGVTEDDFRSGRIENEVLPPLRDKARAAGVFGPQLLKEYGGQDRGVTTLALVAERCGPHLLASPALNAMAPDEATMHLLLKFGDDEQRERWLGPLARGETRSCFAMTEPDAGSDPRRISTRAERVDGGWRINGRKVFTTGAQGAAFCVVMAVSDPDAPPGKGVSMFIVPADDPGFRIVRDIHTMGFPSMGGHPETAFEDVVVGDDAVLGDLGAGFQMAQARLETGRLGHSMRWVGIAQRALDMMAARSLERETFGAPLATRQTIQWWLSDGAMCLYAGRLMILNACWRIEQGLPAHLQVSMVKTFVSEVLDEIVDKALQVFGGWGYTTDFPIEQWYRDARAARIFDGPSEVHRMTIARRVLRAVENDGSASELCGDILATTRAASQR
ncbi:MAG: acyl-CoA dehydrogenase family protein [Actinomycetota bacterium]